MSCEVLRVYQGLVLLLRAGERYELHEDGQLLAVTDSSAISLKLFFRRALDIATGLSKDSSGRVALTAAGKTAFCSQPQEPPEKPPKRFRKPTVEEIAAYCTARQNGLDAQAIYDRYEAGGWKVGRSPMKDWKAAVRTWERREQEQRQPKKGVAKTNPEQSSLDMDAFDKAVRAFRPVYKPKEDEANGTNLHGTVAG